MARACSASRAGERTTPQARTKRPACGKRRTAPRSTVSGRGPRAPGSGAVSSAPATRVRWGRLLSDVCSARLGMPAASSAAH
ncbi:hypothetical protein C5C28_12145 [Rathayibacter rathayi]|uniref:Uncharacterized protein n=1 Tax=Rathayibacter rathayi TaxID=33887 RepID=A0ABD6W763_RATRA|nr:hypothetical protein C5C04_11015 [Rathayibacter rathayi]PPH32608.1 hypothetical protein C5C28_12145 [Rathayibacter rathayi]PPI08030.1 hypothetical protein C5D23_11120 [Rathayibacter rathayi]